MDFVPPNRINPTPPPPNPFTTDPSDGIDKVDLRRLVVQFQDLCHTRVTLIAPHIFPIPKDSTIVQATLTFTLPGSTRIHTALIRLPTTLIVHPASATDLFHRFLKRKGFVTTRPYTDDSPPT